MLYQVRSSKSLDEIERDLKDSAARHQFGVIAMHDLKETLNKKGVALSMECRIYEVCNPQQANKVLEADGVISTALPCRISVFGTPEHYTLTERVAHRCGFSRCHPALCPESPALGDL